MLLANLIFVVSYLKIHPAVHLAVHFEGSDVFVVKKKYKINFVYRLDIQTEQTRILI